MSYKDIGLTYGGVTRSIVPPEYPYTSRVRMDLHYFRGFDGAYTVYDSGGGYDVRTCECTFLFESADRNAFEMFLTGTGRGQELTLSLGSNSGFYPFGPDKGDSGDFTVRLLKADPTGQLLSPWKMWRIPAVMALVSAPSYALPAEQSDGSVTVGTVSGVRYPQGGYSIREEYGVKTTFTLGSDAYVYDFGTSADTCETEAIFELNQTKAAALLNYLTVTGRGNDISLVAASGQYPFGYLKGDSTTFTTRLLTSEIAMEHVGPDQFVTTLGFGYIS